MPTSETELHGPNPHSAASVHLHPLHAMLVVVPMVCFGLAFVTDIVYWQSEAIMWSDASAWLLTVGLVIAFFALIAGLVDYLRDPRIRQLHAGRVHVIGNIAVLGLTILNALVHTRDAYTSVVPTGLILSTIVVLILGVTAWHGYSLVHRHGVGVRGIQP